MLCNMDYSTGKDDRTCARACGCCFALKWRRNVQDVGQPQGDGVDGSGIASSEMTNALPSRDRVETPSVMHVQDASQRGLVLGRNAIQAMSIKEPFSPQFCP